MVSTFKDYCNLGFGLKIIKEIFAEVNHNRVDGKCNNWEDLIIKNGEKMVSLTSSPGIVIENPCKTSNDCQNFQKMAM